MAEMPTDMCDVQDDGTSKEGSERSIFDGLAHGLDMYRRISFVDFGNCSKVISTILLTYEYRMTINIGSRVGCTDLGAKVSNLL